MTILRKKTLIFFYLNKKYYICINKQIMTQVGLFIIDEPNSNFLKRKIFNFLMNIFSEDDLKNIAYCDDNIGKDMLYVFLDIEKHKEIYHLFKKYNVLLSYKNLTDSFLYQKNLNPIFNGGDFKEVLINFLENNLDKDTILDKINDMGIESLNEVDYKILKK
jgi:hypothetical protein